jgi:hypothetical protein
MTRTARAADPYALAGPTADSDALPIGPQTYTLRIDDGPLGEFSIPWGPGLLDDLAALARPDRDADLVGRMSESLRALLAPPGWTQIARQIGAAADEGQASTITIRSDAAELSALPWELIGLPGSGRCLGQLPGLVLRHEWPGSRTLPEQPAPRPEGGRILLAWSAAGGQVPGAEHELALRGACVQGHPRGEAGLVVIRHASLRRLADSLAAAARADDDFAVLHLLCHGGRAGSTHGLVLDGDADGPVTVSADVLRDLLAPFGGRLRLVVLAACHGGDPGEFGNRLGSVALALHRAGIQAVIAARSPLSAAGSVTLTKLLYHRLLGEPAPLETALASARAALALELAHLDWAVLQLHARAEDGATTYPVVYRPFRGLLAFTAEYRRFFYGRDAEEAEILHDLAALVTKGRPRLIVVAGASGSGKSSVVLAGTMATLLSATSGPPIPEPLLCQGAWEVQVVRPGIKPRERLSRSLAARTGPARPLLLIVDQFEEIFRNEVDAEERLRFVRALWDEVGRDTAVHCILTLRIDFIGRCGELVLDRNGLRLDRIAYDEAHRVLVAHMSETQLRAAIEDAGARGGLQLQEGLASRLMLDTAGEPGALPLLQYALDLLWQRRSGNVMTLAAYEQLGGVVGALRTWADALIDALSPAAVKQARLTLTSLVGLSEGEAIDTRRRVALAELRPAGEAEAAAFDVALLRLVEARLVVLGEDAGQATAEVAHEALIRKWPRLQAWVQADRERLAALQRLRVRVVQWHDDGELLSRPQLMHAEELGRRHDLPADVQELLHASRSALRLRKYLRRALIGVLFAFAALFATLYAWGRKRVQEAEASQRQVAMATDENTKCRTQVTLSKGQTEALRLLNLQTGSPRHHTRDLLLTLEAARAVKDEVRPSEVKQRLLTLVSHTRPARPLTGHAGAVVDARFAGGSIVTLDEAGDVRRWDSAPALPEVTHKLGKFRLAAFSPSGRRVAWFDGKKFELRDVHGETAAIQLPEPHAEAVTLAFSPDEQMLAVVYWDGAVRTWQAPWTERPNLRRTTDKVTFSPDSRHLVFASSDGLHFESARGERGLHPLLGASSGKKVPVQLALFDPHSEALIAVFADKVGLFRRTGDDEYGDIHIVQAAMNRAVDAAVSADGQRVAAALDDGTVELWRRTPADETETWWFSGVLYGHEGKLTSCPLVRTETRS